MFLYFKTQTDKAILASSSCHLAGLLNSALHDRPELDNFLQIRIKHIEEYRRESSFRLTNVCMDGYGRGVVAKRERSSRFGVWWCCVVSWDAALRR